MLPLGAREQFRSFFGRFTAIEALVLMLKAS